MEAGSINEQRVRAWFALRGEEHAGEGEAVGVDPPGAGRIMLVTGASGSGKTRLLRAMKERETRVAGVMWVEVERVVLPDCAVADCFAGWELERALRLLGRCGLAEAWTYVKRPGELSEGQRWRLRLALALRMAMDAREKGQRVVLAADEFCAVLDRVTACVVARSVRRIMDALGAVGMVCATSHEDLHDALRPDVSVRCDFGRVEEGVQCRAGPTQRRGGCAESAEPEGMSAADESS